MTEMDLRHNARDPRGVIHELRRRRKNLLLRGEAEAIAGESVMWTSFQRR